MFLWQNKNDFAGDGIHYSWKPLQLLPHNILLFLFYWQEMATPYMSNIA